MVYSLKSISMAVAMALHALGFPISLIIFSAMLLRGGKLKNRLYRLVGVKIGRNTEIMQVAWLDHFCPELISIGEGSMIGAFCKISSHAYEGSGRFRVGLVKIGDDCVLASGVSLGAIRIGDGSRILPNTTLSPYFARLHPGSVVSNPPPGVVRRTEVRGSGNQEIRLSGEQGISINHRVHREKD